MKNKKILLFGFYGRKNSGDDAMLYGIVKYLSTRTNAAIIIPTDIELILPRVDNDIIFIPRNISNIIKYATKVDFLLVGGGSLFHTKGKRLKFKIMVSRILFLLRLAKTFKAKIGFISAGVGPFENSYGRFAFWLLLKWSDYLNVRDKESYRLISDKSFPGERFSLTSDFAFAIDYKAGGTATLADESTIGINVLPYNTEYLKQADNDEIVQTFSAVIRELLRSGSFRKVRLFSFNAETNPLSNDAYTISQIVASVNDDRVSVTDYNIDPTILIGAIAACDLFVTMRYHGILYASIAGVPCISINYHSKCEELVEELEVDAIKAVPIDIIKDSNRLLQAIERHKHYQRYDSLANKYEPLIRHSFPENFFN